MNYENMKQVAIDLQFDDSLEVYNNGSKSVLINRPSVLTQRFSDYNVNTNFQIFLKIGDNEPFRPNHFRVLIDLKLRSRELPEKKNLLLNAFDSIFYGDDPLDAISQISTIRYTQYIDSIDIIATLAQLFIIEQDIGYGKKSKYEPPSLYIQGWIRTFIDSESEIDKLVSNISNYNPPAVKYTCQDDKNHKKFNPNAKALWYKS